MALLAEVEHVEEEDLSPKVWCPFPDLDRDEEEQNRQWDVPEELHVCGGETGCEPVVGEPRDADEDTKDSAEDYAEQSYSR